MTNEIMTAVELAETLQKGFITSRSFGPEKEYELRIKFETLADLQAAHNAIIQSPHVSLPVPIGANLVTDEMIDRAMTAYDEQLLAADEAQYDAMEAALKAVMIRPMGIGVPVDIIQNYLEALAPMVYKPTFSTKAPSHAQQAAFAKARDALSKAMIDAVSSQGER